MAPGNSQTVIVDGDPVVFEGPPPSDLSQLYALIDQALSGGGRLIQKFVIDGKDAHEDPKRLELPSYQRVDVTSIAWEDACKSTLAPLLKSAEEASLALTAYGSAMLKVPLSQTAKEINTVAEKLGALAAPFETAAQFAEQFSPTWKEPAQSFFAQCNEACDTFTASLQNQDIGRTAEILVVDLPDALVGLKTLENAPWAAKS